MKELTEQQKIRRQILFNMPYVLLTFPYQRESSKVGFLDETSKFTLSIKSIWKIDDSGISLLLSD